MLRFRVLGASFSILGASFSSFGCFVFEFWVLRASVFVFECFVFETTALNGVHNKYNTAISENAAILVARAQEFIWLLSTIMT